jgi:lipoate-protein ligase B
MRYECRWLGTVEYDVATKLQETLAERMRESHQGVILGLEHPEVITLGIRGGQSDILVHSDIPICRADRGGQATYHNPGQLVIYPVCPIRNWRIGAREWVENLLQITRQTLEKCNIIVVAQNNGLFTKSGKIASIGLNLKGGVSTHGIAINVSNSLAGFSLNSACGVQKQPMDRVVETHKITPEELFVLWNDEFSKVFQANDHGFLTSEAHQI